MRSFFSVFVRASVVLVVASNMACIIEEEDHHHYYDPTPTATVPTVTPAPTSTAPSPTTNPVTVSLDTGRALTSTPGAGAGVFITYTAGGHWSVQWTCDTNASGQTCAFDVSITTNGISSFTATPQGAIVAQDSLSLRAQTTTGATMDGVQVDVAPGDPIVVSANINGSPQPSLIFFVSDGQLRTAATDPIEFQPTAP